MTTSAFKSVPCSHLNWYTLPLHQTQTIRHHFMTMAYFSWSIDSVSLSHMRTYVRRGLGGLMVSVLDFQAGYQGFKSRSGRDNFQTISTPSSYSTCPGLSIKWPGRRLVTDSGTKCAWVIHESKAVQIHAHNNRRCLYVPRVPGSVKNLHNNNKVRQSAPTSLKTFVQTS